MTGPPLPQFELNPRESIDSELTRRLLEYLLSGALKPGERLPSERTLSAQIGVNRQTIRNAIASLAMLGIVETRLGSGTYFVGRQSDLLPRVIEWGVLLSQSWVTDLIETRYHLEILFAGLAAERRSDDDLHTLRALVTTMETAAGDYATYADADATFHLAVARISGLPVLAGVLGNVRTLLQAWSERVIRSAGETRTSLAMHNDVLQAISDGDANAARSAMAAHMDRAVRRLRDSAETYSSESPSGRS